MGQNNDYLPTTRIYNPSVLADLDNEAKRQRRPRAEIIRFALEFYLYAADVPLPETRPTNGIPEPVHAD